MSESPQNRRSPVVYRTKIIDLIGAGLIKPGDELKSVLPAWPATASVNADGSINYDGRSFKTLSAAGAAVRRGKATNGWTMWAVRRDAGLRTLADIRAQHDGLGAPATAAEAYDHHRQSPAGTAVEQLTLTPFDDDAPDPGDVETVPVVEEDAGESPGLITSFGMFWRREQVNWNHSGRLRLFGYQAGDRRRIDFADQIGVYLLHDGARTVYVGRVSKPRMGQRLAEHTRDRLSGRWDRFSWFGLRPVLNGGGLGEAAEAFGTDLVVATMEAILIEGLEPPQNRRQGDGMTGQEYQQAIDEQLQERSAMETMVRMIQERNSI